jgi:acetyl/propionyl-CoA carboxylase alpha subunit
MKYFVTLGETELSVNLDAEGAHFGDESISAHVEDVSGTPVHMVTIGTEVHRVLVRRERERGKGCYALWVGGYKFEVEALDERSKIIRELSGDKNKATGPAPIIAPMPGLIVRINVGVGDEVHAGQGVVVMEAMKMENELRSASGGKVKTILVQPGTAVEKGTRLVELE